MLCVYITAPCVNGLYFTPSLSYFHRCPNNTATGTDTTSSIVKQCLSISHLIIYSYEQTLPKAHHFRHEHRSNKMRQPTITSCVHDTQAVGKSYATDGQVKENGNSGRRLNGGVPGAEFLPCRTKELSFSSLLPAVAKQT